jgi:hypothetical protein
MSTRCNVVFMGDDSDGSAARVHLLQEIQDFRRAPGIQIPGGLISQHECGLHCQGPRHRDTLLLPTGKLIGLVMRAVRETDAAQCSQGPLTAIAARYTSVHEGQLHIRQSTHARDQIEGLEDEADPAIAYQG